MICYLKGVDPDGCEPIPFSVININELTGRSIGFTLPPPQMALSRTPSHCSGSPRSTRAVPYMRSDFCFVMVPTALATTQPPAGRNQLTVAGQYILDIYRTHVYNLGSLIHRQEPVFVYKSTNHTKGPQLAPSTYTPPRLIRRGGISSWRGKL